MSPLLQRIQKCFVEALGIGPDVFQASATPAEIPNWDSLGHVRLVTSLQNEFNIELDIEEIMGMEDVAKICEILRARGLDT